MKFWPRDRNLKVAVVPMTLKSQKEEEKRGNRWKGKGRRKRKERKKREEEEREEGRTKTEKTQRREESAKITKKQSIRDKKNQEFGVLGAQPRYILRKRMLNCV